MGRKKEQVEVVEPVVSIAELLATLHVELSETVNMVIATRLGIRQIFGFPDEEVDTD